MLAALFFMLERDEKKAVEALIMFGESLKFGSFFHRGKGV